jgi:protein gp37
MAENTIIAWTDHTFNIAWGCVKISPGCTNCYAETLSKRYGHAVWGKDAGRRVLSEKYWSEPLKWQNEAKAAGVIQRVFSSSMCDIWEDHPTITKERAKLWPLIRATPNLCWQLLTKRAERIANNLPPDWGNGYPKVWLGVSAENQKFADERIPYLLRIPAVVHFVSYEPALGPVDFSPWLTETTRGRSVSWIIQGGESGPGWRPMDVQWARNVRDQCARAGVAYFFKQSSAYRTEMGIELDGVLARAYPTPRNSVL